MNHPCRERFTETGLGFLPGAERGGAHPRKVDCGLIEPLDQGLNVFPVRGQHVHMGTKPNMSHTRRTSLRRPLPPWCKSRRRTSSPQGLQLPRPQDRPGQWLAWGWTL